jgi:hypothetical protein
MININFSINGLNENFLPESGLGDMEIKIDDQVISSKDKIPNQSMVVLPTISNLLEGIRLMVQRKQEKFLFNGTNSSFTLFFKQNKSGGYIKHELKQYPISLVEFALALRYSVNNFLGEYEKLINSNNTIPFRFY